MKIGILREGKTPPDKRVPLTPEQCVEVEQIFPHVSIVVQPSSIRCFKDEDYSKLGIEVRENLSDCSVLLGVKEVKINDFIEGKTYLFFSHTIKKQEYNRKLLQTVLEKKVQLVDYEVLTNKDGFRIIGFGRFAGLVGAYNGFRAFGLREKLFELKPAHQCNDLVEMYYELDNIKLPPIKIAVTGDGRVSGGVLEVLNHLKIKRVSTDDFLKDDAPEKPEYVQLLPGNYTRRKDGADFDLMHFFNHPEMYENAFQPFSKQSDLLIAAAYWDPKAPVLFTGNEMKQKDFKITVISDITCDIEGSIPSTKKASTIDDPFYDFNPATGELEPAFSSKENITVQAVDNLPCELPKDASLGFGRNLIDKVFPSLFDKDDDGIVERASITKDGKLTKRFSYLQDFADGK
ncbi:MAG: alanine dehydrogenase [Prolixibacteraceae bacterium]|jgi:saccharopine dehydrogenase (NAD+, L-lysine forming)|nr:alanine dehydrogenase [Prolixibacteraceae bacterium]MBT6006100.1 alanine dehydrogenase [Prolixibacteraceae bacterium]MBT6999444.1 alanine dehydrogenase [Prolixibacteraceae bacterium]MBT7394791.1 alanine dehydrogenase [Prolixibacteraceae bacterium]